MATNQTVLFVPQTVLFLITEYAENPSLNLTAVELDYENDTESGINTPPLCLMFLQITISHYYLDISILKPSRKIFSS